MVVSDSTACSSLEPNTNCPKSVIISLKDTSFNMMSNNTINAAFNFVVSKPESSFIKVFLEFFLKRDILILLRREDLKVIISDKYKTTFNYIFNKQKITNCVVINNSLDITYISLAQGIHYDKTSNGWNFIFQQNRKFFMLLFKLKINTTDYIITLCEDNIIFKKINQYFKDKLYNFLHNIDFDGIFNKICNNDMLYNNNFIYYFYKAYSYYTYIINDIMSKMKNISLKGYKFADDISTLISDKSKQLITDRIQLAKKIIQEYFINNNITIAQINK